MFGLPTFDTYLLNVYVSIWTNLVCEVLFQCSRIKDGLSVLRGHSHNVFMLAELLT